MLYIGLMSGTSADGIDGALVDINPQGFTLLATHSAAYSAGIKESIESVIRRYPNVDDSEIDRLGTALGEDFAQAATILRREAGRGAAISAIGSHGQTVYHGPGDIPPVTVQLGDPRTIAELTGLPVVGDFRANDLGAGGQGAPLAPAFHNAMFRSESVDRVVVNIGGIANLTLLPSDPALPVVGFDTGPGNTLMDQWCQFHTGRPYDRDGRWAAGGSAPDPFVTALLSDPYFTLPAPKSTGREYFHLEWMKTRYPSWKEGDAADIQAGLLDVTARSIVDSARRTCKQNPFELYVCGGGSQNTVLMNRLAAIAGVAVDSTEALGLAPAWVESCAFAWLAHRRINELPGNLPSVTGAAKEVLLGEIYKAG